MDLQELINEFEISDYFSRSMPVDRDTVFYFCGIMGYSMADAESLIEYYSEN